MLTLTAILGYATDELFHERLHRLEHRGAVETITLDRRDMQRHRLRAATDKGTSCAIALPRKARLGDGAVLLADEQRAVVVRAAEQHWLRLVPRDEAAALELGYHAGNMHWRVHFEGNVLAVALEGPEASYLARLEAFLGDGRARRADD